MSRFKPRTVGKPLAVAIIDIDYFKAFNDTHGHPAVDQVLRELAARLEAAVRATNMAARYGGEEFVLVMIETDMETAQAVAPGCARISRYHPLPV